MKMKPVHLIFLLSLEELFHMRIKVNMTGWSVVMPIFVCNACWDLMLSLGRHVLLNTLIGHILC